MLLYDTGSSLAEGAELRTRIAELTGGRRVTHIALSHPHFDHVLGTAAFSGAEVFGAVGSDELLGRARDREALRADAVRHGLDETEATEAVDVLVAPRHVVSGEWTLDLGGRQVLLANVGPGHTGHDLVLLVPGEREVVFCGDLVEESGEPQAGPGRDPLPLAGRSGPAAAARRRGRGVRAGARVGGGRHVRTTPAGGTGNALLRRITSPECAATTRT